MKGQEITLYRSLYRLARKFDQDAVAKVFLRRKPRNQYDFRAEVFYDRVLLQLFDKKQYIPTIESMPSFVDVLKENFRIQNSDFDRNDRLDVGFAIYRNFTKIWEAYSQQKPTNLESEAPASGSSKSSQESTELIPFTEMANPSPGMVLISHPLLDFADAYHHRSIVLILSCNEEHVYGVRINHRSIFAMKEAIKNFPHKIFQHLERLPAYQGGPIRRFEILHSIPDVGRLPIPFCQHEPYYASLDLEKALKVLESHPEEVNRMMTIVGAFVWSPETLENEIKQGKWILGQTHPDQLLNLMLERPLNPSNNDETTSDKKKPLQDLDLYTLVLQSMGDKYQPLLQIPHTPQSRSDIPLCEWI